MTKVHTCLQWPMIAGSLMQWEPSTWQYCNSIESNIPIPRKHWGVICTRAWVKLNWVTVRLTSENTNTSTCLQLVLTAKLSFIVHNSSHRQSIKFNKRMHTMVHAYIYITYAYVCICCPCLFIHAFRIKNMLLVLVKLRGAKDPAC